MGSDNADVVEELSVPYSFKAHHAICGELLKLVNEASRLLPEIEAARPRCSSGIQALCLLTRAIEKANQIIQQCCASSKLYLVLTADVIVNRCEKSRTSFEQSLVQLQTMVPVTLAVEISHLVDDIRSATFVLDSSEEEAGRLLRQLLHRGSSESNARENSELKAFKYAALKLHITSPKAILIEKRSIRKLLDRTVDSDPRKGKILMYLMYLFKNYGEHIVGEQSESGSTENEEPYSSRNSRHKTVLKQTAEAESFVAGRKESQTDEVIFLEEFKCPLSSRLMYDPVSIASGQTFERIWIQKWFEEGNDTCPKTRTVLPNRSMTPNTYMKELISKWSEKHGVTIPNPSAEQLVSQPWDNSLTSIASFGSSVNLCLPQDLSNVSIESFETSFNSVSSHKAAPGLSLMSKQCNDVAFPEHTEYPSRKKRSFESLSTLPDLPWETQCEVVENVVCNFDSNGENLCSAFPENFLQPVVRFISAACQLGDPTAQKTGCKLLLAYLKNSRNDVTTLADDELSTLVPLVDSEVLAEEAFAILEILSAKDPFQQTIAASGVLLSLRKILQSENREIQRSALKILIHLSSNYDLCSSIFSSGCTTELIPLLKDPKLANYSLLILKNLCDIEPARISITETNGCIASIAELLETGTQEEQEHAVSILLMLCSQREEYCHLVLEEGFNVISPLVIISINGTEKAKASAREMLRLVRDVRSVNNPLPQVCSQSDSDADRPRNSGNSSKEVKSASKSASRSSGFFGKMSIFSKQKR